MNDFVTQQEIGQQTTMLQRLQTKMFQSLGVLNAIETRETPSE